MKRSFLLVALLFLSLTMGAQALFVGSYNLRNENSGDNAKGNGWSRRVTSICNQILFEQPDVFGTQEGRRNMLQDMKKLMPDYDYVGKGRDDGSDDGGEHSAIFYNKSALELLNSGDFWMSETPDIPSIGWDAKYKRICSWGYFKHKKSKLKFYYMSLHMDHKGIVARREGAKVVVQKIKEICKGAPVILTGDFNVDQNNEIYSIFTNSGVLADAYEKAEKRFVENGSFNSFDPTFKTDSRIDHIFLSPQFKVDRFGLLTDGYWTPSEESAMQSKAKDAPSEIRVSKYIHRTFSDHYPIFAHIFFKK